MSPRSLAQALVPLADASATQPRSKLHSPFSPLVGWLATWLSSEGRGREAAKTDRFLVPDPDLFISPVTFPELSDPVPPIAAHSTATDGPSMSIALRDDVSEMRVPLIQPRKDGLTEDEFDYVVNSLLEYLEDAELASPESGCEEYEYYSLEKTQRRLRHGLWYSSTRSVVVLVVLTRAPRSPESSLYPMDDSEDEDDFGEAETPEMDEAYERKSLELVRTARIVPLRAELVSGPVFLGRGYG